MNQSFGMFFGGLIAVVLLWLFAFSTGYMVLAVINQCVGVESCPSTGPDFGKGLIYVVTTVGGLVSALVIAQLSVIHPQGNTRIGNFEPTSRTGVYTTNTVIALYLLVWIATGLAALMVGVMFYPDRSSTLSDIGTTWLGLAVSAAYAYFGIKPSTEQSLTASSAVVKELQAQIDAKRITFDDGKESQLSKELLGSAPGVNATPRLQALVLALSKTGSVIRISSIVRTSGHHGAGRAVDIGNEDIAKALLPGVATKEKVKELEIEEIIFDAGVAGEADRNVWNFDRGGKHDYDEATLGQHKDHIHFAVTG